ncbi:hypothetical protein AVEN_132686-1 [Araneus ventricosus]|uniref:Uncharacterized protein n=1 Tax=Araneus ventricosus TaxID=182803 RepID=A0A4Y2AXA4_ARAVE|nr:hypothetical protein AVEN_132686-1 [Araneus ventricosus]
MRVNGLMMLNTLQIHQQQRSSMENTQFPIHERHRTVIHLSFHHENVQRVYFPRQIMLLNVPKHLRKQHSYFSADFAPKMSLHAPYCTMKYPSTTLGAMETRHSKVENKGKLY